MRLGMLVVCFAVTAGCFGPTSPSDSAIRRPQSPPPPPGSAIVRSVVTDLVQHGPLSGVYIHWGRFSDCEDGGGGSTDANGAYTMSVEPSGSVRGQVIDVIVCATKAGYREHDEPVRLILDSSEVTVNFTLTPSDGKGTSARR